MLAPRRDDNEGAIVKALRAIGCLVVALTQGKGVPDLLVWSPFLGRLVLLEVKDGGKTESAQRLTTSQVEWHAAWTEAREHIHIVSNIGAAYAAVGYTGAT